MTGVSKGLSVVQRFRQELAPSPGHPQMFIQRSKLQTYKHILSPLGFWGTEPNKFSHYFNLLSPLGFGELAARLPRRWLAQQHPPQCFTPHLRSKSWVAGDVVGARGRGRGGRIGYGYVVWDFSMRLFRLPSSAAFFSGFLQRLSWKPDHRSNPLSYLYMTLTFPLA